MKSRRIWEIDLLRVIAILLMVTFHIIFDLNRFVGVKINYLSGFWYWEGKVSALAFIFLSGISSGFSKNTVKRGLEVLSFAIIITLVTFIFYREEYIRFGILHFLGVSIILSPWMKKMNNLFLFISSVIIALSAIFLRNTLYVTGYLLSFGVMYKGFATLDYYPLIPYLSVFILGILVYKIYYYKRKSLFNFSYDKSYISFLSKNSLAIYLIHQPIIIAVIYLSKLFINR